MSRFLSFFAFASLWCSMCVFVFSVSVPLSESEGYRNQIGLAFARQVASDRLQCLWLVQFDSQECLPVDGLDTSMSL